MILSVVELGQNLINSYMQNKNNNNLFHWRFSKTKGQGILEVVIAISVVIVGLVSIMSLVIFNINVQGYNHNMLIASNLAREGVEIIRNIRDSNWLDSEKEWDDSLFHGDGESVPSTEDNENSFITFNRAAWELDNFTYDIVPVGMFWEDCIDDNHSIGYAACKLHFVPILSDPNYKIYNYGYDSLGSLIVGSSVSNFYRLIYINEICNTGIEEKILTGHGERCKDYLYDKIGLQVISKVGWKDTGSMKIVEVEERLYNWK